MSIDIGSIIESRYRIVARIGHGGMAEVFEALDLINKKSVAIKLVKESIMNDPLNLRRFQNEATIAANLNHPNIVKVYNHGTVDGIPYIANEFIDGQTLKNMLDFRSSLSIEEALDYMIQLTSALQYAHQHMIIHRDIKPDNIYVMSDGTIKLGDFGIAQTDGIDSTLTSGSEIVGSVHYLAPELVKGKSATKASDIYACGVTFYELITGHTPFNKTRALDIALSHINEKMPPVSKYLPNCPEEVEKIIAKATKKDAKDRYGTAKEFHDDLIKLKNNPNAAKEKKSLLSKLFGFK